MNKIMKSIRKICAFVFLGMVAILNLYVIKIYAKSEGNESYTGEEDVLTNNFVDIYSLNSDRSSGSLSGLEDNGEIWYDTETSLSYKVDDEGEELCELTFFK